MFRLTRSLNRLSNALVNKSLPSASIARLSTNPQPAGGLSFQLSDEQKELVEGARKFVRDVVIPNAAKWDRNNEYPVEAHKQAHELGFFIAGIPTEYGGLGLSLVDCCLIGEELNYGCSGFATSILANELALGPVRMFANDDIKRRFLARNAEKSVIAAYAVTEPGMSIRRGFGDDFDLKLRFLILIISIEIISRDQLWTPVLLIHLSFRCSQVLAVMWPA